MALNMQNTVLWMCHHVFFGLEMNILKGPASSVVRIVLH